MDFHTFAQQIAQMKQLLDSQERDSVTLWVRNPQDGSKQLIGSIKLEDDGSGLNNLMVVLEIDHDGSCPHCGFPLDGEYGNCVTFGCPGN